MAAAALGLIRAADLLFGELARFHDVIPRLDDNITPEISTLKSAIFTGPSHSDPFNKKRRRRAQSPRRGIKNKTVCFKHLRAHE
ncbi:hypothetical protein, partial [Burkholderia vietnamiensis]|uniref:hypothetical protein n=1 Tax=Burkholderia vietnamiensis TaxID=60552 RepID=UPI001F457F3D